MERREAVMKGKTARAYLDRFGTVTSVLKLDALTWRDVAVALDEAEFDIERDVFVQVTTRSVRLCPEDRPHLEHPLVHPD
jgi:hypothetical protein